MNIVELKEMTISELSEVAKKLNVNGAGVVAYDLPASADAHVLWKTSRGNDLRNGQGEFLGAPDMTPRSRLALLSAPMLLIGLSAPSAEELAADLAGLMP